MIAAGRDGPPRVDVFPAIDPLAHAAAEHVARCAERAIAARGRFVLALSGGSTPRALYALLAAAPYAERILWNAVHVCWGDERCVPPDDTQSNFRMANDALLSHVPIPEENVHRIRGEEEPSHAAAEYEATLRGLFRTPDGAIADIDGRRFDLVLLGLGADGHTASLFPDGEALRERVRWVTTAFSATTGTWRVTLTLPVLNSAAEVLFLVTGADKAVVLNQVLVDALEATRLPAQRVHPESGRVRWLADASAAQFLTRPTELGAS